MTEMTPTGTSAPAGNPDPAPVRRNPPRIPQDPTRTDNPPRDSGGLGVVGWIFLGLLALAVLIGVYAAGGGFSGNPADVPAAAKIVPPPASAVKVGGSLRGQARCDEMFPGQGRKYVGDTTVGGVVGAICRGYEHAK